MFCVNFSFHAGRKIESVFEQHTVLSLIMDCNPGRSLELGVTEATQAARQPAIDLCGLLVLHAKRHTDTIFSLIPMQSERLSN